MKEQEISVENYDFKKLMKQNIKNLLFPTLNQYGFIKSGANKYARETNGLLQIILFNIEKDRLKAFAAYYPIFVPYDYILNYGIEITGSTGIHLLDGKYYTTLMERSESKEKQIEDYYKTILPNFNNIVNAILEGVIPEMEENNSLSAFINKFESEKVLFFGHTFDVRFTEQFVHQYIWGVYDCLYNDFHKGIEKLKDMKTVMSESILKECIEQLLNTESEELTKEQFISNLEKIVEERRKKFKLKIK